MRVAAGIILALLCSTADTHADDSASLTETPARRVAASPRGTPSERGLVLDYSGDAYVLDSTSDTYVGNIHQGFANPFHDCVISPDGSRGYATDFHHHLWIFDLAATTPRLAEGTNPIPITPSGEGVASTPDGRTLVVCAGAGSDPVSVVDAVSRAELSVLDLGAACVAVEICGDGSVLLSVGASEVRRYVLDATGHLLDTGDRLSSYGAMNISCSPDGASGIVANSWDQNILSFRIPGLAPVSQRNLGSDWGISGAISSDGSMYFVRGAYSTVYAYAYDQATATLGSAPEFTLPADFTSGFYGVAQLAFDHASSKLYVPVVSQVRVFDPASGAPLDPIPVPTLDEHTGICFRPRGDLDGDGLLEDDEIARGTDITDPDTDDDGLLDGFEAHYGFNPLVAGDQLLDGDGDGLDNLGEQTAHTDPTDPDSDDDGMPDGQEVHVAGTNPLAPDTDRDGVLDGADNCPARSNADQRDVIHPNGIGDVCDDFDHDGASDLTDDCPDAPNVDQADLDGDGTGDACDAYPAMAMEVIPGGPSWALTGAPVAMTFRLVDPRDGRVLDDVTGVLATLTVDGSAVFGSSASEGVVISGGGTARVLAEFVRGIVTIEIQDEIDEKVTLGAEDSQHNGITVRSDVFQSFERNGGGFTHSGTNDGWQWGVPLSGPGHATSGEKVWATNLSGEYPGLMHAGLVSPSFTLDVNGTATLEFDSWVEFETYYADSLVQVSTDAGVSWTTLAWYQLSEPFYSRKSLDLTSFRGETIRVRFMFISDWYFTARGWYLDDIAIRGIGKTLEFVSPVGDLDADGLLNTEEVAHGTNPNKPDTDGDYVSDGAEVHVYGTSPVERDTDGGGRSDGDEIDHGADPRNPVDDSRPELAILVDNSDGAVVFDANAQTFVASVDMEYGVGDCVISRNGKVGYVTDFAHKLWVVDLTTSPPRLADGINPIVTTTQPEDIAMTADGRFLIVIDGNEALPLSVIDVASRTEVDTFDLDGVYNAVEICNDGSVLVASYSQHRVRRLIVDRSGRLSDTGERIAAGYSLNAYCAPDARSGIALAGNSVRSFTIPGLTLVDEREIADLGVCGATTLDGKRVVVRTHYQESYAFDYDPATAQFGSGPAYTIGLGQITPYYGIEQLAIDGSRVYAPYDYFLWMVDVHTGERASDTLQLPQVNHNAGICFRPLGDSDGDGVGDYDELIRGLDPTNPDSDGDGLSDGFESRNALDPRNPGDAAVDPDGDGLDNRAEQEAHTGPFESDTDKDGLNDGVEVLITGTNPHDPDSDDDNVLDPTDNCPNRANADQADNVHPNKIGDACEDPDGDGRPDLTDNCVDAPNADQLNGDGDSLGDSCDPCTDPDGDGFGNPGLPATTCSIDNCPGIANPTQSDPDMDGLGDACDNCRGAANPSQSDIDADEFGDACDSCVHVSNRVAADVILNGGFETGDLASWTTIGSRFGAWIINNGTTDPIGPVGPLPPIVGSFDVMSTGFAPMTLSQVVSVPHRILRATLGWSDRILSDRPFLDGIHEWRVGLSAGTGTTEVFSTNAGDPQTQFGPNPRSFDLTGLLQSLEGQAIRLDIQQQGFINSFTTVAIDNIRLVIETEVTCNAPLAQAGADFSAECSGPSGAVVHLNSLGSTDPDSTANTADDIVSYEWFEDFGTASQRSLGSDAAVDTALPLGDHRITLKVTDRAGEFDTDETTVTISDTVAPTLSLRPSASLRALRNAVVVIDACDPSPRADVESVVRAGTGYAARFKATDGSGNSATATVTLPLPFDPVSIRLGDRIATVVSWAPISEARHFDVIRGRLDRLQAVGSVVDLGALTCTARALTSIDSEAFKDTETPAPGEAFFYLVQVAIGPSESGYDEPSAIRPRVIGSAGPVCH